MKQEGNERHPHRIESDGPLGETPEGSEDGALSAFQAGEPAGAKALRCFGGVARRRVWLRPPRRVGRKEAGERTKESNHMRTG